MAPYEGPCVVSNVSCPCRQYEGIDVYFQAEVDGMTVTFLIEDKKDGQADGEPLARYLKVVVEDDEEEDLIKPVFFKTGYVFSDERETVECEKYSVFEAKDLVDFLDGRDVTQENEILRQYREYLADFMEPRTTALADWNFTHSHVQWEFMLKLRDLLERRGAEWQPLIPDELSDSPPNSDWLWLSLGRGVSSGRPWTQYWFAKHLFWRLDSGMPLRLMIFHSNARMNFGEITRRYWNCFDETLQEQGLCTGGTHRKCGNECTIGSVETADFQGMEVGEFLERVTRVHTKFLESISTDTNR